DYVQAALKGDIVKVAQLSFDCIHCGLCAMRCPAGIVPYHVAQLARRLYARYISKPSPVVTSRVKELKEGKFDAEFEKLLSMKLEELKQLYEKVEMEE
ncbi:MAG: 4Fe-4S dicluster domain-containing protein, partial [Asgard group archaeon]